MSSRKEFLSKIGSGAAALTLGTFFNPQNTKHVVDELGKFNGSPTELATNESFWYRVQQAFTVDRSLINLNNGKNAGLIIFGQELEILTMVDNFHYHFVNEGQ